MKNILIIAAILAVAAGGLWYYYSSDNATESTRLESEQTASGQVTFSSIPTESKTKMETGTYKADTNESSIEWEAGKPAISGYVHHGTFSLQSGEATLTDGELSGEFVVDMNSLKIKSLGGGKVGKESALEAHLKSDSFFDVANNPTATFTITDVEPKVLPGPGQAEYTATGNLTLKGETKPVTFPIKVFAESENEVWMTGSLPLDRTEWGIDFGSAKVVEAITDQVIGDTVNLDLVVKLTK